MAQAKSTTDHETIRRWAEERGGHPVTVKGTGAGEDAGILRIDFPKQGTDEGLEPISWDEFFEKFDDNDLQFLYQEETEDGNVSRFNKFVNKPR
jgi:hypothetical protein